MTDQRDEFSRFLLKWSDANVGDLGNHTDPSDHQFYYGRCAAQLREDATESGYGVEIGRLAREYKGGLREYIEGVYRRRYPRY